MTANHRPTKRYGREVRWHNQRAYRIYCSFCHRRVGLIVHEDGGDPAYYHLHDDAERHIAESEADERAAALDTFGPFDEQEGDWTENGREGDP